MKRQGPGRPNILYVMAAEPEYGPHLRQLISPLMTGVGPVEAALEVGITLAQASLHGALPEAVVSLGSAGSAKLEQTGIYQAVSVSYRDMDASALGIEKGRTPFLDFPATLPLGPRIPGLSGATLSTGANIVSGERYNEIKEDMVDMESFAVLRACQKYAVPLIVVRGISDGDSELSHVNDWTKYLHIIDHKLAEAVQLIEDFWRGR